MQIAVFIRDAGIGFAILCVLFTLLAKVTKRPFLSKLAMMFFALVIACASGWSVVDSCVLRSQGLGHTLGRTSHIVSIASHSTETLITFWLFVPAGSLFCLGSILAAIVVLIPDKDKPDESGEERDEGSPREDP